MPTVPIRWRFCFYLSAIAALMCWLQFSGSTSRDITHALFTGWLDFIRQVLPAVRLYWPSIITGAAAAIIFLAGLHMLASWIVRGSNGTPAIAGGVWKVRWTLALVGLVVLLFTAGVVLVAIVHHVTWLTNDIVGDRAFRSRVTW